MMMATRWPDWVLKTDAHVRRARRRFDGRGRRERILILACVLAACFYLAHLAWLSPLAQQWSQARERHIAAAASLQNLNDELLRTRTSGHARQARLRQELAQLRERFQQQKTPPPGGELIAAADMVGVLDQLLMQVGGLRLHSMQSLPRIEVPNRGATAPARAKSLALYRHGVELTVEGSYADLLNYLHALDAMPQRVLWGGMQLTVEQYPKASLTLRLYTLSSDRTWLAL